MSRINVNPDLQERILTEVEKDEQERIAARDAFRERLAAVEKAEAETRRFTNLLFAEVHRLQKMTPEMLFGPGQYGMKNDKIVAVYVNPRFSELKLTPMLLCPTTAQAMNFTRELRSGTSTTYIMLVVGAEGITVELL